MRLLGVAAAAAEELICQSDASGVRGRLAYALKKGGSLYILSVSVFIASALLQVSVRRKWAREPVLHYRLQGYV